jgi:hypothetical protein
MFEEFSSGYYFGRLEIEPADGDRAVIQRDQHERVNEQLYTSGEGIERLDAPLVMKLDTAHFPVHGETGVPQRTLQLPRDLLEECSVRNPPSVREVLLAKADRARQLLRWTGGWQPAVGT